MDTLSNDKERLYLENADDGLPCREAGSYTEQKLDYLSRYINTFTTSSKKNPWCGIHYIDLFSGPGKCRLKETGKVVIGSPIIALKTKTSFSHCFFVDSNNDNIETLKIRCNSANKQINIEYICGDCNQIVQEIVNKINKVDRTRTRDEWPSLNFAFLDQEGFDLEWNTLISLGEINRLDLLIYFSDMGINRELGNAVKSELDTKVDRFFGTREWRDISKKSTDTFRIRNLIDFYLGRLTPFGYKNIVTSEPLMRNNKNAPLYRLLFASKHELGYKLWADITKRDVDGQMILC